MNQLQDFLDEKERRIAEVVACREILQSTTATKEEKKSAGAKMSMLRKLIDELNVQIYALDPSALKKGWAHRKAFNRARRISLDGDDSYNKSLHERIGFEDDYTGLNENVILPKSHDLDYMKEALKLMPKQWVRVWDLRSKGMIWHDISVTLGYKVEPNYVGHSRRQWLSASHAMRTWIVVRRHIDACKKKDGFDWDRFLTDLDLLPPRLLELLICLIDSTPNEWNSYNEIGLYLGWSYKMSAETKRAARHLKWWLINLKIPLKEIDAVHPFLASVKEKPLRSDMRYKNKSKECAFLLWLMRYVTA